MPHMSMNTPIGSPITIFEWSGRVSAIDWGTLPEPEETPALAVARDQIEAFFAGQRQSFDFAIAPIGTPFQQRVWAHLRTIPFGTVQTYGAVAQALATAPRAIGAACARNPLPIVIPCHRVVGSLGAMTGYSGYDGVATKRRLLEIEGVLFA